MPYTLIKAFERGIDTRKLIDTTEPGALLDGRDCHVTLGGEVEKRAAFVTMATLPPGTVGLYVTEGRVYNVWGDSLTPPVGLPPNTVYHAIPEPEHGEDDPGTPLTHILSVEEIMGGLYVIAEYEDLHVLHWWRSNGAAAPTLLVNPDNPPVVGGGDPPDTSPEGKPQALMYFQLMFSDPPADVYLLGVYLFAPGTTHDWGVDAWPICSTTGFTGTWPTSSAHVITACTSPAQVAAKCMNIVNAFVPPGVDPPPVTVSAQVQGGDEDEVLFWINDASSTYNGWRVEIHTSGPCLAQPGGTKAFSGGVTPTPSPSPAPPPIAATPGSPITKGRFAIAHNERMWCVDGTYLNYSALNNPAVWSSITNPGAGQIDMSQITARKPHLISLGDYRGDLAIFAKRHIIIYRIDTDPNQNFKRQALHGTGTFAPHSVEPFGEGDVMYLDISGIRSLRARDSSDAAFSADIGTMIDDLVRAKIRTMSEADKVYNVWAAVEPRSGRLWMALLDKIYVLSFYPSSRIAAWTWYDATDVPVDYMNVSDDTVYWRTGDDVIAYGGEEGDEYDDTEALALVPYIDGGKPASFKNWTGIDAAIFGTWSVRASFDPTVPTAFDLVANLTKSTYAQQKVAMNGESPAVALEFTTSYEGPAKLGNASVHYTSATED